MSDEKMLAALRSRAHNWRNNSDNARVSVPLGEIRAALSAIDPSAALASAESSRPSVTMEEVARVLEPFAERVSDGIEPTSNFIWSADPDDWDAYGQRWGRHIKVAHCRAARDLLSRIKEPDNDL